MSWDTIKLLDSLGISGGELMRGLKEQKSLQARKEIEGPKLGIPNQQELRASQDSVDTAQKGVDETRKKWSDTLDVRNSIKAPELDSYGQAYDPISALRPDYMKNMPVMEDDITKRNRIQALQMAAWEKHKKDTADKTVSDRSVITPEYQERTGDLKGKETINQDKKQKKSWADTLSRVDWDKLTATDLNRDRLDLQSQKVAGRNNTIKDRISALSKINDFMVQNTMAPDQNTFKVLQETVNTYNAIPGAEKLYIPGFDEYTKAKTDDEKKAWWQKVQAFFGGLVNQE